MLMMMMMMMRAGGLGTAAGGQEASQAWTFSTSVHRPQVASHVVLGKC